MASLIAGRTVDWDQYRRRRSWSSSEVQNVADPYINEEWRIVVRLGWRWSQSGAAETSSTVSDQATNSHPPARTSKWVNQKITSNTNKKHVRYRHKKSMLRTFLQQYCSVGIHFNVTWWCESRFSYLNTASLMSFNFSFVRVCSTSQW